MPIKFRRPSKSRFFHNVITASDPKCGICYFDVKRWTSERRVEHFQKCWEEKRAEITQNALLAPKRLEKAEIGSHERHFDLMPPSSAPAKAVTGREKEKKEEESQQVEHSCLQCPICCETLIKTSGIDAFTHLQTCISTFRPIDCPYCTHTFGLFPYSCRDVLGHLYLEHIVGVTRDATPKQKEHLFDGAMYAWSARQELLRPAIYGIGRGARKNWGPYEQRDSYAWKKKRGNVCTKLHIVETAQYDDGDASMPSNTHNHKVMTSKDISLHRKRKQSCLEQDTTVSRYFAALPSLNANGFLDEGISMPTPRADSCVDQDEEHVCTSEGTISPPRIDFATTSMEELDAILSLQDDTMTLD